MNVIILDDVLQNPKAYREDALSYGFDEVFDADKVYKGIQPRSDDEFQHFIENQVQLNYKTVYSFIKQLPKNEIEQNIFPIDRLIGSHLVALLFLNETHPSDAKIVHKINEEVLYSINMKYNRAVLFGLSINNSNISIDGFGEGDESCIVQAIFLKKKD
jgi:hypothetical protein